MKNAEEILRKVYNVPDYHNKTADLQLALALNMSLDSVIQAMHEYASQSRWVNVSDVEPEIDVPYNIVYSGVVQWVAYKFDGENWVDMHDIAPALPKNDVSHYQPLPTPPKD